MEKDNTICQYGTPNGILAIITIGDVNGTIEHQNAKELSGLLALYMAA